MIVKIITINQKIDINSTDTTFYNYLSQSVDFYPEFINQELDSVKLWISSISSEDGTKLDVEISFLHDVDLLGLEFKLDMKFIQIVYLIGIKNFKYCQS